MPLFPNIVNSFVQISAALAAELAREEYRG